MQVSPALLVVDDDPEILSSLSIHLRTDGYRVLRATGGKEALAALEQEMPALAIVDLMMPGMDGFETSRRIKRRADIPIIILTAIDTEETKVRAIEQYADDYLTKPFSYAELAARVGRILKRAWPAGPPASVDRIDEHLTLDFAAQTVQVDGETRRLSPTESRLLHLLYANAGRILPNELILDRVWPDAEGEMSYLWEYIRRLREKLGDDPAEPRYIASERGIGYSFIKPA
jgi:two-component system, OmpR family, KDP operon response regulator KdpE